MTFFDDPQQGHTTDSLTPITGQFVNVTPNNFIYPVQPYHQSLMLAWVGGGGGPPSQNVNVVVSGVDSGLVYYDGTLATCAGLERALPTVIPLFGSFDTSIKIAFTDIVVKSGTLFASAMSTTPIVTFKTLGVPVQSVNNPANVGPGATVIILPAPNVEGHYWRVKLLSWRLAGGAVAGTSINWRDSGGNIIVPDLTTAATDRWRQLPVDFVWQDSISLENQTAVALTCSIVAEDWLNG